MKKTVALFCCLILTITLLPQPALAAEEELIGGQDSGIINLLLIGQDGREDLGARSDCVILCTLHPESKTVTITSFLRDLYVPIPGFRDNRFNAAYALGGTELLKKTLKENFDLYIDGCLEVDFSSFPQIIDALGGVLLELRQDEAQSINDSVSGSLTAGLQRLTGEQALAYSRIRNLDEDGDFSRTQRQRKVVNSLLDSYRSADLWTVLSVVAQTLPLVSTDLSKRQILVLAATLFPLLEEPVIRQLRIPADGTYTCQRIGGMDILAADLEDNKKVLRETLLSIKSPDNRKPGADIE